MPISQIGCDAPRPGKTTYVMSALGRWLQDQRTSVRLAFILRVASMALNAVLSLLWTRVFLRILGDSVYGTYLSFMGVTRLGGLGDFGLSGALAVRVGQAMGRGDYEGLKTFLPAARALLLLVAAALSILFLAAAPWLPSLLGFQEAPGSGSLVLLFATGAPALFLLLTTGYFNSLNLAHGTVTWPIIPSFIVTQLAFVVMWLAARAGMPLWVQHLATVAISSLNLLMGWWLLKTSHPWLANLLPLRTDKQVWRDLASTSGWMYLYSIGSAIYVSTDRILINAGFGAALVPTFLVNAKLCELVVQVVSSGAAVSLPKIIRWISSPEESDRHRVITELRRLGIFQTALGTGAALVYLVLNNVFVTVWLGEKFVAPPIWQFAFALNLAITAGTDAATQTAGMCGADGLRKAGLSIGAGALINLGLSYLAMRLGSIAGIAFATVIAQAGSGLFLTWITTQHLQIRFFDWAMRSCVFPVLAVTVMFGIHQSLAPTGLGGMALALGAALIIAIVFGRVIGLNRDLVNHEIQSAFAILKR